MWTSDNLKWNPEDFSGIEEIIVPPTDVWLPDILISNRQVYP